MKSLVDALEDQSDAMVKLKKEITKITESRNELYEEIKSELSQGKAAVNVGLDYNQKLRKLESSLNNEAKIMDLVNDQNTAMNKLRQLEKRVDEGANFGSKPAMSVKSTPDPGLEIRMDNKFSTIEQRVRKVESKVDELETNFTRYAIKYSAGI